MVIYKFALVIHITCVVLSGLFFMLRGFWMFSGSHLLQAKFTRVAPHIIDTALLLAAVVLTLQINQYPLMSDWLTVKLVAFALYIGLGTIALKRGKTRNQRIIAFALALLTFAFIISVALLHHPLGLLFYFLT